MRTSPIESIMWCWYSVVETMTKDRIWWWHEDMKREVYVRKCERGWHEFIEYATTHEDDEVNETKYCMNCCNDVILWHPEKTTSSSPNR